MLMGLFGWLWRRRKKTVWAALEKVDGHFGREADTGTAQYAAFVTDVQQLNERMRQADLHWRRFSSLVSALHEESCAVRGAVRKPTRIDRSIWESNAVQQEELWYWIKRVKEDLF